MRWSGSQLAKTRAVHPLLFCLISGTQSFNPFLPFLNDVVKCSSKTVGSQVQTIDNCF